MKNRLLVQLCCACSTRARVLSLSLALLITGNSSLYAASTEPELSLTTAIKRSLQRNPALKIFSIKQTDLQTQLQTAYLKPAYELDIESDNFLGSRRFNGLDNSELTVSLSSVIELGGKIDARTNLYSDRGTVLRAQQKVKSLELLGEVTRRYIHVLTAQARVALAVEATDLAQRTLADVTARSKAGLSPEAEVKRAAAAHSQAQLALSSEHHQLRFRKFSLAAMWGDSTAQYPAVSGNLFQFGIDVDYQYLQKKVEMNPAIDVFLAEERLRDSEIRLAKTESTSDIRWSIGVKRFQETSDTALTAGVSMPLFSQKRNTGAVSSALASRNIVRFQKDIALINMRTQLFRAYSHRQQAILSANTLKDKIVPELKEALRETQIAYIRGRYSYLDYVAARQELLDARRMLIDAAATALSYGIEIEQLTAEPLSNSDHNDRFLTED